MRIIKIILLLLLTAGVLSPVSSLTVKLGSPFPEGSAWDTSLKRMASEWREITGGEVTMRIYPGGVAGDEADMIRKIRFGQLDAGVLTIMGLKTIVPDSFVMALPGILKTQAELNYTIRNFAPRFDEQFVREGFRVLAWSNSGWANFYAKSPARTPDLLRREKLSVGSTDEELAANFKALNFNVVPSSINELTVALQSGMVSAFYAPPMAAAAYQWFALAPYLIDFPVAPVLGSLVISERTWSRIPAKYHEQLKAAITGVAGDFDAESERLNIEALKVMNRNGLKVEKLSKAETDEWYRVMKSGHALVIGEGNWVTEKAYKEFLSMLEGVR
jgi:TRAP-type C4-dicarboxylate transport system substrate-binding protein